MVRFTSGMNIECLKVHSAPWFASFLCAYNHSMAPCNRVTNGNLLDGAQANIFVETFLYSIPSSILVMVQACGGLTSASSGDSPSAVVVDVRMC